MAHELSCEQNAIVSFSGGQDSSTALAWALDRFAYVETVGFDYGQKHAIELEARSRVREGLGRIDPAWRARLGSDHIVRLDLIGQISGVAIEERKNVSQDWSEVFSVGRRYIPTRNMIMLSLCGSVAYRRRIKSIVYGVSEVEYSGYPDCRMTSIEAINVALNVSSESQFIIECPIMRLRKAEVWRLAERLGGEKLVSLIVEQSHTCYIGERNELHEWGYGCGTCDACELRSKGWREYKASA